MDNSLNAAFGQGYERMAAWSDLLDDINLFPVPDADTGRNLRISLAPLKFADHKDVSRRLLMSATGNSGNIAGAFFAEFTRIDTADDLLKAVTAGKDAAWSALGNPKPGTMLSVFDALARALQTNDFQKPLSMPEPVLEQIKVSVLSTADTLSELRQADVVDSGALGMFLFFEGFLKSLAAQSEVLCDPYALFGSKIRITHPITARIAEGFCIDTVIVPTSGMDQAVQKLAAMGEHMVTVSNGERLKVHFHTPDASSARQKLAAMGKTLRWKSDKIECHPSAGLSKANPQDVHIVTDAAGSLSRDAARELGITLLDSYIILDGQPLPESAVAADMLYAAMSRGAKVTTAQASIFERHQHYDYLTRRYANLVYLCVGSVYTGNFEIADQWAGQKRESGRMAVVDTGAASGRLGLIARRVVQFAGAEDDPDRVVQHAEAVSRQCDELVFLDQLKFLAAGGRISKSSGFFGDLLNIKPIIHPGAQGAQKVGVVKSRNAQVEFLLNHLGKRLNSESPVVILLQYTDNQERVQSQIQPRIQALLPLARISVQPMSLTSGVHMGRGTWAAAFLPEGSAAADVPGAET